MKKILVIMMSLFCFYSSQAQSPDITEIAAERLILQERRDNIGQQLQGAEKKLSELKLEYKDRQRDSSFHQRMATLKRERLEGKEKSNLLQHDESALQKKRALFDRSILTYYRTQPFFKYRNKSKWNMAIGVGMVSAGGVALMSGFVVV